MTRVSTTNLPREWKHGLCDCLEDGTLCCSVCWCQCNSAGQVYERAVRSGGACFVVSVSLWGLFLVSQILSQTANAFAITAVERECTIWGLCATVVDWDKVTTAQVLGGMAGIAGFASVVLTTCVLCTARKRMRHRDGIEQGTCGDCDDCCVSYWCGCCSTIQMLRQGGVDGHAYRPCTSTAV